MCNLFSPLSSGQELVFVDVLVYLYQTWGGQYSYLASSSADVSQFNCLQVSTSNLIFVTTSSGDRNISPWDL